VRRAYIAAGLLFLAVSSIAPLALATDPKILKGKANVTDGLTAQSVPSPIVADAGTETFHGGLLVEFQEVGLGSATSTSYVASASASATYACVNGGSNNPKASNKITVSGPESGSATFASDANGQVRAQIAMPPLGPGSFSCPSGQDLVLASVSYTNVRITDTTNNVFKDIPGTFTLTLVNLK